MTGTIINVVAIVLGGAVGLLFGSKLPERLRQTIIAGLGLFSLGLGISMFVKTQNSLVVLASLLLGTVLGEWLQIEGGLERMGIWLQQRFARSDVPGEQARFVHGFLTASLLFCIGPVAILGSIQDGLIGDYNLLTVKSIMDGFASIAFASSLGVGVLFSALPILIYQGAISLMAGGAQQLITNPMIVEMSAAGGLLLMGVALNMLEIKKVRVGNMLPALFIAPLIVALMAFLGFSLAG